MTFLKTQICFNLCLLIIFLNYHVGEQQLTVCFILRSSIDPSLIHRKKYERLSKTLYTVNSDEKNQTCYIEQDKDMGMRLVRVSIKASLILPSLFNHYSVRCLKRSCNPRLLFELNLWSPSSFNSGAVLTIQELRPPRPISRQGRIPSKNDPTQES